MLALLNELRQVLGRRGFLGFLVLAAVGVISFEAISVGRGYFEAYMQAQIAQWAALKAESEAKGKQAEADKAKAEAEIAAIVALNAKQLQKGTAEKAEGEGKAAQAVGQNAERRQAAEADKTEIEAQSARLGLAQQEVVTSAWTAGQSGAGEKRWPMVKTPLTGRLDFDQANMALDAQDNLIGPRHPFYGMRRGGVNAEIVEPENENSGFTATTPKEARASVEAEATEEVDKNGFHHIKQERGAWLPAGGCDEVMQDFIRNGQRSDFGHGAFAVGKDGKSCWGGWSAKSITDATKTAVENCAGPEGRYGKECRVILTRPNASDYKPRGDAVAHYAKWVQASKTSRGFGAFATTSDGQASGYVSGLESAQDARTVAQKTCAKYAKDDTSCRVIAEHRSKKRQQVPQPTLLSIIANAHR
jgi:hypothetical protein